MKKFQNNIGKYLVRILVVGIIFLSSFSCLASASGDLIKYLDEFHTLKANFIQFTLSADKAVQGEVTKGVMHIMRPGKFRWETYTPLKQILVANGDHLWIYDLDLNQATKKKIDLRQAGNPAMLLTGTGEALNKSFRVKKIPTSPVHGVKFKLYPRLSRDHYEWIELYFVKDKLAKMIILNNLGLKNKIVFQNLDLNSDIPESKFNFKPPQGVDVVNDEES